MELELELEVGDELFVCFDFCELLDWLELGDELDESCELFVFL